MRSMSGCYRANSPLETCLDMDALRLEGIQNAFLKGRGPWKTPRLRGDSEREMGST